MKYDYWKWFKYCVKELKIAPSEFWGLDFVDIYNLLDCDSGDSTDLSISLRFRRKLNGATEKWLTQNR
mgnify:FL=1